MPPALSVWIANSAFFSSGELKNFLDYVMLVLCESDLKLETDKLEHVIYVFWWNSHTVVSDKEEAMCRSCFQYLPGYFLTGVGNVDDRYCRVFDLGRHLERC